MPGSGTLAAPKTASSPKERDKNDGWAKGTFLTVRGPCKKVAASGAPGCEYALYTDVQDVGCQEKAACYKQPADTVWEGHKGSSGRDSTWLPAQAFASMSLSQMATYYLAAYPTKSFQSLNIMKHRGTITRFCI